MSKEKDLNALKERVNYIDPGLTESILQFILTPKDLGKMTCGGVQEISLDSKVQQNMKLQPLK